MSTTQNTFLQLTSSQILRLELQGCFSTDWSRVRLHPESDLSFIRNTRFYGDISIGLLGCKSEAKEGLFNAVIENCVIGNHPYISNISGTLKGLTIGDNVLIENCGRITGDSEADCGLGVTVAVLDETGSRPVPLFPTLTAQLAVLLARYPRIAEHHVTPLLKDSWASLPLGAFIGDNARVMDCVKIENVRIDPYVTVDGASYLGNGRIINNGGASPLAFVGAGVNAENFMIVDGRVDAGCLIRNCFVGQGVELSKNFTAHDSLFFANSTCECGEACAIIAGPHTVTMHKSSLLIGAEYSFMNAGSGTNSSNHMYKLGPVHWGIMQRGVKTASSAYMMWEGHIGAYSLLMGSHKSHPDTSEFPFSYLFGNPDGKTIVAPALMLRSCGLMRDKIKWPKRDRRRDARLPLLDNVHYEVLNPMTVSQMLGSLPVLREIAAAQPDTDGFVEYKKLYISPKAASRAVEIYTQAIVIYMHRVLENKTAAEGPGEEPMPLPDKWIDLGGQLIPNYLIDRIKEAEDFQGIEDLISSSFHQFPQLEYQWVKSVLTTEWLEKIKNIEDYSKPFNDAIEADRKRSLASLR